MKYPGIHFGLGSVLLGALVLTSCGSQGGTASTPPVPVAITEAVATAGPSVAEQIAEFAARPELQDAESQAILKEYANDPLLLQGLKEAYGLPNEGLNAEALALQAGPAEGLSAQATGKAGYAQSVAWGSISHYFAERRSPNYSGLDWNYDGCSAPKGLGLGYNTFFRNACNVHDFGYRNLPKLRPVAYWPYNKAMTDSAFLRNMRSLCNTKSWYARPGCYAAAQAYYSAVNSAFGWLKWHR
ncbi:phospholipase A2 [Deinococcus frigens]|uniref:phospholipase A2 n=1 Tax=Deinococcus frigens TaxID=249403 RepID=UPI00068E5D04|nr:phospholipase A2 [Deinococcus frigens]